MPVDTVVSHAGELMTAATGIIAFLLSVLIAVVAWIGKRLFERIDEMQRTLHTIEGELHNRITDVDRRLARVEARCDYASCKVPDRS